MAERASVGERGKYDITCLAAAETLTCSASSVSVPVARGGPCCSVAERQHGDGALLGRSPADDELAVFPDPDAIVQLTWQPSVAFAPGNLYLRGEPYPMCSRTVLSRQTEIARQRGFTFNLGMETEFYFVKVDERGRRSPWNPRDVLDKPCHDTIGMLESLDFLDEMVGYLNALGWDVHSFDHEDRNGQYEFDFSYTDGVAMADRFMLFRLMAKDVARSHG